MILLKLAKHLLNLCQVGQIEMQIGWKVAIRIGCNLFLKVSINYFLSNIASFYTNNLLCLTDS